jgi:aspartate carbamoyltransferase catalytic subunit
MSELSTNHLLGIKYLVKSDIELIFETASQFKEVINRPIRKVPSMRDITVAFPPAVLPSLKVKL